MLKRSDALSALEVEETGIGKRSMVSKFSLPKPQGMCNRHNLTGLEMGCDHNGLRGTIKESLRIGPCTCISQAELAMYLVG
jgi:hypothetical protein